MKEEATHEGLGGYFYSPRLSEVLVVDDKQPMAGPRRRLVDQPMETVAFANRRKKNRRREQLAKAARKKQR